MKKMSKLTKKLLLSALALGLAVVTLTTTTFAWYTSSTTAAASSGEAGTSSQTSDSSLLISDAADGVYGTSVNLPKDGLAMIPLQFKDGKFVDKEGKDPANNDAYYEFKLYFKTTSYDSATVYLKSITLKNSAADLEALPDYDNLLSSGNRVDGTPALDKYSVDIVSALDMVITTNGTPTSYNLGQSGFGHKGFNSATPNGNVYYDKFMGTSTSSDANTYNGALKSIDHVSIGEVGEGVDAVLEVTFAIYLNGWDNNCFDACKGQSFTVNLEFTTEE